MPVTENSDKEIVRVPCIHYPVQFQEKQIRALLNSGSKFNALSLAYAKRLGLKTRKTNIGAQKTDGSALEIFGMVIADFQVEDKDGKPRFFQETFLMADTKFEVILRMPFLKLSNADMSFGKGILTWKSYTINKALPTTERVRLVDPKEFVIAALDADSETFVVHVAVWEREEMAMNSDRKAQVEAQSRAQIQDKAQVGVQSGAQAQHKA